MKSRNLRKGMSEMMAIVIGVVLTVAIGAALWPILTGMINSQSSNARMAISISATSVGPDNVSLVINVRNIGTSLLKNIEIYQILVNGKEVRVSNAMISESLPAGQSASKLVFVPANPGDVVTVIIKAQSGSHVIIAQAKTIVS